MGDTDNVGNLDGVLKRVYPDSSDDKTANDSHTKRKRMRDIINKLLGREVEE